MYATAGNLDTFLLTRSHSNPIVNGLDEESISQRIKAFKKRRKSSFSKREENRGVMLLGLEEVMKLFGDVVEGLAFLVRTRDRDGREPVDKGIAFEQYIAPGFEV